MEKIKEVKKSDLDLAAALLNENMHTFTQLYTNTLPFNREKVEIEFLWTAEDGPGYPAKIQWFQRFGSEIVIKVDE